MEILVVHSNRPVAAKIYAALRNAVFPAVIHRVGSAEALSRVDFGRVRLVVLDWDLAWSTGRNALTQIRLAAPHARVIVRCGEPQHRDAREAGADGCMTYAPDDREGVNRAALEAAAQPMARGV